MPQTTIYSLRQNLTSAAHCTTSTLLQLLRIQTSCESTGKMLRVFKALLAVILITASSAFRPQRSSSSRQVSTQTFAIDIKKAAALAFTLGGLGLVDPTLLANSNGNDNSFHLIRSANADVRAQQKRTYFRFVPKLVSGMAFYQTDVKAAIDKEDYAVISKFFEVFVTKYNADDKSQVDATDTYVNQNIIRPMIVFSGSFAERGSSPKTKALKEQEQAFEKAMGELEGCVKDRKGEGFFAADIKMPTGAARKKQAQEAYASGKKALNAYVKLANAGLMLELNKLPEI